MCMNQLQQSPEEFGWNVLPEMSDNFSFDLALSRPFLFCWLNLEHIWLNFSWSISSRTARIIVFYGDLYCFIRSWFFEVNPLSVGWTNRINYDGLRFNKGKNGSKWTLNLSGKGPYPFGCFSGWPFERRTYYDLHRYIWASEASLNESLKGSILA